MGYTMTGTGAGLARRGREEEEAKKKKQDDGNFFDDPVLNDQYKDIYKKWDRLHNAYFDSNHGINDATYLNLDEKGKGQSRQSVKDVLTNLYKEALAKGTYKEEDLRNLDTYKNGIEPNSKESSTKGRQQIFTETDAPNDELGLGKDKVDKATILAQLRDQELQLDRMKKMQGYKGTPRTETPHDEIVQQQNNQGTQQVKSKQNKDTNNGYSGTNDFDISDSLLQYNEPPNLNKAKAKAWDTLDPTNFPIGKQNSSTLGTIVDKENKGVQFYDDGTHINSLVTDAQIDKIKQRKKGIEAELSNPNILPERKAQLQEIAAALNDGFGADIAKKDYRDAASSIRAYDADEKNGVLTIPSQTANIAQLDGSFIGTLNQLMEHDKAQGKLTKGLTAQQMIDGAMGSQYFYHDLFGDEYADFRDRHKEFFEQQIAKRNELVTLDDEFKKAGGYKSIPPVTESGTGDGTGVPKLRGVQVPYSQLNWTDPTKRPTEDLVQGASNVTFGALGTVIGAVEGAFGASYQNQRGAAENVAALGSTIGRGALALQRMPQEIGSVGGSIVSGIASSINPVKAIGDVGNRSGWNSLMNDIGTLNFYKSPTATETSEAAQGLAQSDQVEAIKPLDNPVRDVIQGLSEMVGSIGFGEFSAASKFSTGAGKFIGRGAELARGERNINEAGRAFEEAVSITNRIERGLSAEARVGKIGSQVTGFGEVVNGTTEGRKAIALARYMLPPSASLDEAAHLATTLAVQHVAQHMDNLSTDDVKDGVKSGTLFALSNFGIGKVFGTIGQSLARIGSSGKMADELAEKISTYKRWANVGSQMVGNPVQTVISKAVETGDIASIVDPSSYANKQAAIDIGLGMLGIKDALHASRVPKAERVQQFTEYQQLVDDIASGIKTPYDLPNFINTVTEREATVTGERADYRKPVPPDNGVKQTAIIKWEPQAEQPVVPDPVKAQLFLETVEGLKSNTTSKKKLEVLREFGIERQQYTEEDIAKEVNGLGTQIQSIERQVQTIKATAPTQRTADGRIEFVDPQHNLLEATHNKLIADYNKLTNILLEPEPTSGQLELFAQARPNRNRAKERYIAQRQRELNEQFRRQIDEKKPAMKEAVVTQEKNAYLADLERRQLEAKQQADLEAAQQADTQRGYVFLGEQGKGGVFLGKPTEPVIEPTHTEAGTPIEEVTTSHSILLNSIEHNPVVAELGKQLYETETDPVHKAIGAVLAELTEGNTARIVSKPTVELSKDNPVPGMFNELSGNVSLATDPIYNPTEEHLRGTAYEEIAHAVGNKAIGNIITDDKGKKKDTGDAIFRAKIQQLREDVAGAKELHASYHADADEGNQYFEYHVEGRINNGEVVPNDPNFGMEKEFLAGIANPNTKLAQMLADMPADDSTPTKPKTLWDKFKEAFLGLVKKGTKKEIAEKRTMLDRYLEILKETPREKKPVPTVRDASGALRTEMMELKHIAEKIGGVEFVDNDLLNEDNINNLRVIKSFVLTKAEPYKYLDETLAKAYEENVQSNMEEMAIKDASSDNVSYNMLSSKDKIARVASVLIKQLTAEPEGTVDRLMYLSALGDIVNPVERGEQIESSDKIVELAMLTAGIPNSRMLGQVINSYMALGHDGYRDKMEEWGAKVSRASYSPMQTAKEFERWSRSMWRSRHNEMSITPLSLRIGSFALAFLKDRTTSGKAVETKRDNATHLRNFVKNFADRAKLNYYKSEEAQQLLEAMNFKSIGNIQETVEENGRTQDGFSPRNTKAFIKSAEKIFEQNGYFIVSKGAKGNMVLNFNNLRKYVFDDLHKEGTKAFSKLNELHNTNMWHFLESERTWKDATGGERFGKLPYWVDLTKVHDAMNNKGKTLEQLTPRDVMKTSVANAGGVATDAGRIRTETIYKSFDSVRPMFKDIADKLRSVYVDVHGEKVDPFVLRYDSDEAMLRKGAHAELMTIINTTLHNLVDGGSTQYMVTGLNKLPKWAEKYLGVALAPYSHYKEWKDAKLGLGKKFKDTTDEDYKSIYAVHTRSDGTKHTKSIVLNADILPDGHILKDLHGKVATDGAVLMFHEKPWEFLSEYTQASGAGHIKLGWANYNDGFTTLHKGDNHYIPIDAYKEIAATDERAAKYLEPLIDLADSMERQGIFSLVYNTTLKGSAHKPKVSPEGYVYDTQRNVIGVKNKDGSVDTKAETLTTANLGTTLAILNGEAIPNHAIMEMDLHGENAVGIVKTSKPTKSVEAPGIDMHNHLRSSIFSEYGQQTREHFDTFLNNKIDGMRVVSEGYSHINEFLNGEASLDETKLKSIGTFLQKLAETTRANEEGGYSSLDISSDAHRAVLNAIDANGNAIPEKLHGLLLHKRLFTEQVEGSTLAEKAMLESIDGAWKGKSIGAVSVFMPDMTAYADHLMLLKHLENNEYKSVLRDMNNSSIDALETSFRELMGNDYVVPDFTNEVTRDNYARLAARIRMKDSLGNSTVSPKENPVDIDAKFKKDQIKANYADGIIAHGSHSTGKYAERFGGTRESFKQDEIIMISVNGRGRPNQAESVERTKQDIDKAVEAGVKGFVADNKKDAMSSHNADGEGVIGKYIESIGYRYTEQNGIGLYLRPGVSTSVDLIAEHINPDTGTYADGSMGVSISADIFEKFNRALIKDNLPPLTLGSRIMLKITPSDEIDSLVPMVLMGIVGTPNSITTNKEWAMKIGGKDHDGDDMGIILPSRDWFDSKGTNHFDLLYDKLVAMGVHKGLQKEGDNQAEIMKAANEVVGSTSKANAMIKLVDGTTVKPQRLALNPTDPDYLKANYHSLRDIGIEVEKLNGISQAFQNIEHLMKPVGTKGQMGYTIKGDDFDVHIVYDKNLMKNMSVFKQLGAVDMYVPHTMDMQDLLYGTFISGVTSKEGVKAKWSKLPDSQREPVKKIADNFFSTASGGSLISFKKNEVSNPNDQNEIERVENRRKRLNELYRDHLDLVKSPQGVYGKILRDMTEKVPVPFDDSTIKSTVDDALWQSRLEQDSKGTYIYKEQYEKANAIIEKIKPIIAPLIGRFNWNPNRTTYGKDPLVDTAMLTRLYAKLKLANYNKAVPNQKIIDDIYLSNEDANGAFIRRGEEKWYLKDIVKEDGTILQPFEEAMKGRSAGEILFAPSVQNAVDSEPLTRKESDYVLGSVIANVAKSMERASSSINSDLAAGTLLTTGIERIFPDNDSYDGTLVSFTNRHLGDGNASSDVMRVLESVEAAGIIPVLPNGVKLRTTVEQAVASQARQAMNSDNYGSVLIKKRNLEAFAKSIESRFPVDKRDVTNPEQLQEMLDVFNKDVREKYGDIIPREQLEDVLALVSPRLFLDHKENGKRASTDDEAMGNFINGMYGLYSGLENVATAIKRTEGDGLANKLKNMADTISPFTLNTQTQLINTLSTDQQVYSADHPVSVTVSNNNGNISVHMVPMGATFDAPSGQAHGVGIYSRAFVENVMPHMMHTDQISNSMVRLDQFKSSLQASGANSPDIHALIEAADTSQFVLPDVSISVHADGVSEERREMKLTYFIPGKEAGTVEKVELNVKNTDKDFFTSLRRAVDGMHLGAITSNEVPINIEKQEITRESTHRRYSRNYNESTPLGERRVFSTELFPDKSGHNKFTGQPEYVQGEAWARANASAQETGEPIYIHDIPTNTWHVKESSSDELIPVKSIDLAHQEAIKELVQSDRLHVTSKLEERLGEDKHHEAVKDLYAKYGKEKDHGEDTIREEKVIADVYSETGEVFDFHPLSQALQGKEKGIKDAFVHVLANQLTAVGVAGALQGAQARLEHYASGKDLPIHLQQFHQKNIKDIGTVIKDLLGTGINKIIRDMGSVNPEHYTDAYLALESALKGMSDDKNMQKNFVDSLTRSNEHADVPTIAERKEQEADAMRALKLAMNQLAKLSGRTTSSMVWRSEDGKRPKVEQKNIYTQTDVLEALGLREYLTFNSENAIERYQQLLHGTLTNFDDIAKSNYMQNPETNPIAHTNILHALSTNTRRGELDQVNEDTSSWTLETEKARASGMHWYNPIDVGTKINFQYSDNSGDHQSATGYMLGTTTIEVRNEDGSSTGQSVPMAVIANSLGNSVRLIRTDELKSVRSYVHHTESNEFKTFQKLAARSEKLSEFMREIREQAEITRNVSRSGKEYYSAKGIDTDLATGIAREITDLTKESQTFIKQWRDAGNKMAVMGSYMHLNDVLSIAALAVHGAVKGTEQAGIVGGLVGMLKGMAGGIWTLGGKSVGTMLDNFLSVGSTAITMTPSMFLVQIGKMIGSNTGFRGLTKLSSARSDEGTAELSSLGTEARLRQHGAGQIAGESGLNAYTAGEFAELSTPGRWNRGRTTSKAMRETEKLIMEQMGDVIKKTSGIRDITAEAMRLGIKYIADKDLKVHVVDGNLRVTHLGEDVDSFDHLRVDFMNMLGATSSLYALPYTEVLGAKLTSKLNTNFATENTTWDDWEPIKRYQYLKELNNLAIGNYAETNFQRKSLDAAKLATLYQTFSAGKFAYKTEGLATRLGMFNAYKTIFGAENVKEFTIAGVKNMNPKKQLLVYAGNGVADVIARQAISNLVGASLVGITLGSFGGASQDEQRSGLAMPTEKLLDLAFSGSNIVGTALGTSLMALIYSLMPDEYAKNTRGKIPENVAERKEMWVSNLMGQAAWKIPSGKGTAAVVAVPIYLAQVAKDAIDPEESRKLAEAESKGEMNLAINTAFGLTGLSPFTAPLQIFGSTYKTIERQQ